MSNLIGTNPEQIPINGNLGSLAFQEPSSVIINSQADISCDSSNLPTIQPSLNLDFVNDTVLDPKITFIRATTASYYDGNTTALAEQNLLWYSQTFDNLNWVSRYGSNIMRTNAATAPDGTMTAALFAPDTTAGAHTTSIGGLVSNVTYLCSMYVKYAGWTYIGIGSNNSIGSGIFNVSTGTVVSGAGTPTITPVGNGWYRISAYIVPGGGTGMFIGLCDAVGSVTNVGDGINGVYIWGVQAEQRTALTAYTPTSQNVNLLTYSEDLTNAIWAKTNSSVSSSLYPDPLGYNKAQKLVESGGTALHGASFGTGLMNSNGTFTYSAYLKAGERTSAALYIYDGISFNQGWFNLSTGAVINTDYSLTSSITSIGNGWYRCSITCTVIASANAYGGISTLNTSTYAAPTELVTNGTFTTDTTGWIAYQSTIASVSNTLQITAQTATSNNQAVSAPSLAQYAWYKVSIRMQSVNGSKPVLTIRETTGYTALLQLGGVDTGGAWVTYFGYFYSGTSSFIGGGLVLTFSGITTIGTTTAFFDDVSIKQVSYSYGGDGTSGIYVYGNQLEKRATVQTLSTAADTNLFLYSNTYDNIANWSPNNTSISNNLLTYSEQLDNVIWSRNNTVLLTNNTVAPNGTTTSEVVVPNSGTNVGGATIRQPTSITSGLKYTLSFYAKSSGGIFTTIAAFDSRFGGSDWVTFTLSDTGSYTVQGTAWSSASIIASANGWYRCTMTATAISSAVADTIFYIGGVNSVVGDGTSGVNLWGTQLEVGGVASDYTATTSTILPIKQLAPDGTYTAEKLTSAVTAGSRISIRKAVPTVANTKYIATIYAKSAEWNFINLFPDSTSLVEAPYYGAGAVVDLSTGISNTPGTARSTYAGNGWWKIQISFTPTSTSTPITISYGGNNTTLPNTTVGDGYSGIYIWGASVDIDPSASTYVPVTTGISTSITNYIPVLKYAGLNEPRFNYDPVTRVPKGLLIEESRTNLLTYSQDFSNVAWTKSNINLISNTTIAPDGTLTASSIYPLTSGVNSSRRLLESIAASIGTTYTLSVYIKTNGKQWVFLASPDAQTTANDCWFDVVNGVVGTKGANCLNTTITNVGNGWFRLSLSSVSTAVIQYFYLATVDANGSATVTANNTAGIYVWGAQIEAGTFATSYIPTTSATVTRNSDFARITGTNFSSWYNHSQGTMYAEWDFISSVKNNTAVSVGLNTNGNNRWFLELGTTAPSGIRRGAVSVTLNGTVNFNILGMYLNGAQFNSWYTNCVDLPVANLAIGFSASGGSSFLNGHIRNIKYYPIAQSNNQLQWLTTK